MTFPVDQGQNMRFLAFVTNDREDWPSDTKQCLSTTKAEALDDFRAFGPNVKHIIKLATGGFERVGQTVSLDGLVKRRVDLSH